MNTAKPKDDGTPKHSETKKKAKKKAKKQERAASATPATLALGELGFPYALHSYTHDPDSDSYGSEAAEKLQVDSRRVFKTLITELDDQLTVAVLPVTGQLNFRALASAAGFKRGEMAAPATAERVSGYRLGGISPLGMKKRLPVIIDTSCMHFPTLMISAGRRGLELEVQPQHLIDALQARIAPITH